MLEHGLRKAVIYPLDNDDLYYDEIILDVVYHTAVNGSFDIDS